MRELRPSELAAILPELQRQMLADAYHKQRNNWAFLAAVITNGFSAVAGMFSKRKPKMVQPDDFIGKELKQLVEGTEEAQPAQSAKKTDWASLIQDAREKGLVGPW